MLDESATWARSHVPQRAPARTPDERFLEMGRRIILGKGGGPVLYSNWKRGIYIYIYIYICIYTYPVGLKLYGAGSAFIKK